jgi:hypothetical protein
LSQPPDATSSLPPAEPSADGSGPDAEQRPSPALSEAFARARSQRALLRTREQAPAGGLPSNRGLAFRLVLLSGLFVWAMLKIGPGVDAPEGRHALLAPKGWERAAVPGPVPDIMDVLAGVERLDTVAAEAVACPAHGTVRVTLGPEGLLEAELEGGGEILCVARLTWGATWPRGRQQVVLEREIGAP